MFGQVDLSDHFGKDTSELDEEKVILIIFYTSLCILDCYNRMRKVFGEVLDPSRPHTTADESLMDSDAESVDQKVVTSGISDRGNNSTEDIARMEGRNDLYSCFIEAVKRNQSEEAAKIIESCEYNINHRYKVATQKRTSITILLQLILLSSMDGQPLCLGRALVLLMSLMQCCTMELKLIRQIMYAGMSSLLIISFYTK